MRLSARAEDRRSGLGRMPRLRVSIIPHVDVQGTVEGRLRKAPSAPTGPHLRCAGQWRAATLPYLLRARYSVTLHDALKVLTGHHLKETPNQISNIRLRYDYSKQHCLNRCYLVASVDSCLLHKLMSLNTLLSGEPRALFPPPSAVLRLNLQLTLMMLYRPPRCVQGACQIGVLS